MISRKLILMASLFLLMASCTECRVEPNACASDSIDSVGWISELKKSMSDCTCQRSIIRGTYEGQTVFFVALTDPACDGIDTPVLYNCDGKIIRGFSASTADQDELNQKVTRDVVMYTCSSE